MRGPDAIERGTKAPYAFKIHHKGEVKYADKITYQPQEAGSKLHTLTKVDDWDDDRKNEKTIEIQKQLDVVEFEGVDKQAVPRGKKVKIFGKTRPPGYTDKIHWYNGGNKLTEGRVLNTRFDSAGTELMKGRVLLGGAMSKGETINIDSVRMGIVGSGYVPVGEDASLEVQTAPAGYEDKVAWKTPSGEAQGKTINFPTGDTGSRTFKAWLELNGVHGPKSKKDVTVFAVDDITLQGNDDVAADGSLVIDSGARDMPGATFEVTADPGIGLGSVADTMLWHSRLKYDEGNYTDIDDEVSEDDPWWRHPDADGGNGDGWVLKEAGATWSPEWDRLMGAEAINVLVRVSIEGSSFTPDHYEESTTTPGPGEDSNDTWVIQGENPENQEIVNNTDNDWERAMVWQESGDESQGSQPEQFNEPDPGFPNINLGDNPPGWGITQITRPLPTRLQIWNWLENLNEGVGRLTECRSNAEGRNEMFYARGEDPNDEIPSWDWNPEENNHVYAGTHTDELQDFTSEQITSEKIHWLEAYFRFNSSVNSMFDPDGTFRDSAYGGGTWNEAWDHTFTYDESDGDLENSFYSTYAAEPWQ